MSRVNFSEESRIESDDRPSIIVEPDGFAAALRARADEVLGRPDTQWANVVPTSHVGQCYAICEAYYHGVGADRRETLTPEQVTVEVNHPVFIGKVSHWYLRVDDDVVIDPTWEQFDVMSTTVPYDEGRGRGFVPPSPSSNARELLADEAVAEHVVSEPYAPIGAET